MTVGKLIQLLQGFDQNAQVVIPGSDGHHDPLKTARAGLVEKTCDWTGASTLIAHYNSTMRQAKADEQRYYTRIKRNSKRAIILD